MDASGSRADPPEPRWSPSQVAAGDPPRAPSRFATRVFTALLFASLYILSKRWRNKGGDPSPAFTPSEIAATVALAASLLFLLPFADIAGLRRQPPA